jgi:hypothetical protein
LSGKVYAPVGLATHYHTLWVNPYWASSLDHIGTIGAHRFYRTRGASGQASAFANGYAGLEPVVSGRTAPAYAPPAHPVTPASQAAPGRPAIPYDLTPALARKQDARLSSVVAGAAANPAEPATGTGAVKAEYVRAGQWKAQPGAASAMTD